MNRAHDDRRTSDEVCAQKIRVNETYHGRDGISQDFSEQLDPQKRRKHWTRIERRQPTL